MTDLREQRRAMAKVKRAIRVRDAAARAHYEAVRQAILGARGAGVQWRELSQHTGVPLVTLFGWVKPKPLAGPTGPPMRSE